MLIKKSIFAGLIVACCFAFGTAVFAKAPVGSGKIVYGTGWKKSGKDLVITGKKTSFKLNSNQTVVWIGYLTKNAKKGLKDVITSMSNHKVIHSGNVSSKAWGNNEIQSSASVKAFEQQIPAMKKPGAYQLAYMMGKTTLAKGTFKLVK